MDQQKVHVQQRRQFAGRIGRQVALERGELGGDRVTCRSQAGNFSLDLSVVDEIVRNVDPAGGDEHCAAYGHAARHRQSKQLDAHADNPSSATGAQPRCRCAGSGGALRSKSLRKNRSDSACKRRIGDVQTVCRPS